jgi:hypothetical protein
MTKRGTLIFILASTTILCCRQGSEKTTDVVDTTTFDSTKNVQAPKTSTDPRDKHIYNQYEYKHSNEERLVIQNSFPKSGGIYTDPNGKQYTYAVFWTRIINETANAVDVNIDFPIDPFEMPSSSGNYMKLFLPSETMTIDKEPLFDYGLAVKSFLNSNRNNPSTLKKTISAKDSSSFYVVALSNHGVNGTLRTGFRLKQQDLYYRINDKTIHCGNIVFQNRSSVD